MFHSSEIVLGPIEIAEEDNIITWKMAQRNRQATFTIDNLPKKIDIVVANEIYIEKTILPPPLKNRLIRIAAFQNPEFYKAQSMRLPVFRIPRIFACAHEYSHHIGLPRGWHFIPSNPEMKICVLNFKTYMKN